MKEEVITMMIKWENKNSVSNIFTVTKGIDEHGNQYCNQFKIGTCICTFVDGRSAGGWTPEEAF